jgi:transcriptional regulator with XRE-family HTH domain
METFGGYVRKAREKLQESEGGSFSLRQVAARVGVAPAYLSQVERDEGSPPAEQRIKLLAQELRIDSNILLAMAGKVSSELQSIVMKRPELFAEMLIACKSLPDNAILKLVREVRDGEW